MATVQDGVKDRWVCASATALRSDWLSYTIQSSMVTNGTRNRSYWLEEIKNKVITAETSIAMP
jgi:hypothetical protein